MEREQLVKLVTAAQNGDSSALNELFNAFYNDVYYFALKTVKDGDLACDITQEAFVEIINTLPNLKEPAAFITWMKQITYHQCTRYFKKKKDFLVDENEDGETIFDTVKEENSDFIPDEALDKDDFKNTILKILDELSEEQRSATMMYYFDELSVKQIAEIQGVSEGTIKSRLNYARKAIKASVEAYEKKNGIKLHAFPFFPFIHWIFKGGIEALPFASAETVAGGVSAATGAAISATAGSTAAAATATATATTTAAATTTATATATTTATTTVATTAATATGIGAKIVALPLVTKIIAGVTAAVIAVGGGTTAVIVANNNDGDNDNQPSSSYVDGYGGPSAETLTVLEGIIPDMCTYTMYDGTVLTAGQPFPETCTRGDKVEYGDYYYGYECIFIRDIQGGDEYSEEWITLDDSFDTGDSGVTTEDILGCWTPCVIDRTQEYYGTIVSSINGKTINNLFCTFQNCKNMKTAPAIPETVTSISVAFYRCASLRTAPVIPKSVKRMSGAFWDTSVSGEVVINGKLDTSTDWYYGDVFRDTYTEINLTGEMSEEELFMIAENSNNPQITVNGKPVVFYYDTDRLSDGMTDPQVLLNNVITFYNEEPAAGYGGDYESGEVCSAIYSAHALADHFSLFDVFGYNINVEEFMILNIANGDAYYTFTKDQKLTSDFQVQYSLFPNFRTDDEVKTQIKRDVDIFKKFLGSNFALYVSYDGINSTYVAEVTDDILEKVVSGDNSTSLRVYPNASNNGMNLYLALSCTKQDGHYVYNLHLNISVDPKVIMKLTK